MREPVAVKILVGVHVLLADADVDTRDLLEVVLTYCGALVTQAVSAAEAVAVASRSRPDVVVAALDVAGEHGEFLRDLRALGLDASIPVVVLVNGRDPSAPALLSVGFAAHVRKPVEPWAFCRVVADLARKA